ncbi:MAG: RNA-dependent DNA polymerase [Richelia sp. RM1_1_1]|nr:RNA-dependent DNA polymerase [Richelia sp. RM1_1_1]
MIRHSKQITSESWKSVTWTLFKKNLFRLQKRVFKAVRAGNKRKARSLQKLIFRSRAARFLAIRQVTQLNQGKRTAGVDGKTALTFKERFNLELLLKHGASNWYHNRLREIPIPKKNGFTRILKVPTIADRAWQCIAKYALEPAHEATFHAKSYGFRTGRSAHDAQKAIYNYLNSNSNGINKKILEIDIEKCFDRINHNTIMSELIAPRELKKGIWRCLKAGTNPEFPEQGTPQGGTVSPLLANIALNGIEELTSYKFGSRKVQCTIRYADDMVIILRPQDDVDLALNKVKEFLAERGMNVSEAKTKLTASTSGFNFLGWNFYVQQNGKFRSIPSEDNFKAFRKKVKKIVNCSNYGTKEKAKKLAPIVRGWRQYHKNCKLDGSRFSLWHLNHRTFKVFNREKKQDRHKAEKLVKQAFPPVPYSENSHIMVKGDKSPFDGDLIYWSKRKSKLYHGLTSKLLTNQSHTCGHCGLKFSDDESIHLHHIDGNHNNWKQKNLTVVHQSCHQYIHMGKEG